MIRRSEWGLVLAAWATAIVFAGCGTAAPSSGTNTPAASMTSTVAPASATASAPATGTPPTTNEPSTPGATSTPPPSGDTGISGIATIGPTCPVERPDSPCPDRPYEALITVWHGTTMVAETRSGADGRFTVIVPPGEYRIVGESGNTFPHGTEVTVTVVEGQLTPVTLRFDSGIR